jgi:hypothetical protein
MRLKYPCVGGLIPPLGTIDFIDFFSFQVTKNGPLSYRNAPQQKAAFRQFAMASGDSVQYACARTLHSGGAPLLGMSPVAYADIPPAEHGATHDRP